MLHHSLAQTKLKIEIILTPNPKVFNNTLKQLQNCFEIVIILERGPLVLRNLNKIKKRDRIAIMAEILRETITGRTKTNVMHKCNLNYKQIQMYTEILLEKKLLTKKIDENEQVIFVVTQKGKNFIKKFYSLQAQIEPYDFE